MKKRTRRSHGHIPLKVTVVFAMVLAFTLVVSMCFAGVRWTANGVELRGTIAAGDAFVPQITSDGAGGAIVVWTDSRWSGSDIFAQRVDASGNTLWDSQGVLVCGLLVEQSSPEITSDGSGGAIIAWEDKRDGSRKDIYVQRLDSAGAPQWTANGVELRGGSLTGNAHFPQITSDGSGGAIVSWYDGRNISHGVYAQKVDSAGAPQWTANGVELRGTVPVGDGWFPQITSDGSGGAIVTWQDDRSGGPWAVYARRVDSAGTPLWTVDGVELRGNTVLGSALNPQITSDGSGGAIVVWKDGRWGGDDIYAQRVDASGSPLWTAQGDAICVSTGDQTQPHITSDSSGNAIIAWRDKRGGSQWEIYTQKVNSAGAPQWTTDGVVLRGTGVADSASLPQITSDGSGGAIITWVDGRSVSQYDVYAQGVDSAGVPQWTANGVELRGTGVTGDASNQQLTTDGSGGAIVTWQDGRGITKQGIYAQRVSGDTTFYFAEGYTGSGFQEYLCLGNPWNASSDATITYMFVDGTTQDQVVQVPANSRTTVDVNAVVGPDKQVSARVLADRPIVVERPMYFSYNGVWAGGHDSVGATAPSGTWYFAEGYTGLGFDEYICVLNPGDTLADLTFVFQTQEEGEKVVTGFSVAPHSRVSLKANDLLGGGSYQTSLKLESTQPVVAERPMYFDYSGTASWGWQGGHCVMGTPSLSKAYYLAEGTTRGGFEEWLTLQNPSGSAITIDATYQLGPGQGLPTTKTYDVAAGFRRTLYIPDEVGTDKDVSVFLSSASDFLAERPMYFDYSYPGVAAQGGHCVIGATSTAQEWFLAEGYTGPGFNQWLCLQNPGNTTADIHITYLTQEAGPLPTQDITLAAGTRLTLMVNDTAGPDYQLSTRIVSDLPIVVERPMYFNYNGVWPGGHDVVGYVP